MTLEDKAILIIPFIFGSVIGSFLNVCIYRIPSGISIVSPPSRCPSCHKEIPFYYNIPVAGWFILRGRCAHCASRISFKYPLIEAMTGFLASALFLKFGLSAPLFAYFAFSSALTVVTFIDLEHQIIPDVISLPGIVAGFTAAFFISSPPYPGVIESLIGILLGGGLLLAIAAAYYLLTRNEGMGGGDVKLLAMVGAFIGWKGVLLTVLAGSFLGAAAGLIAMAASGKGTKHPIPFGPFLSAGALLHLFFGDSIIGWYIARAAGG